MSVQMALTVSICLIITFTMYRK